MARVRARFTDFERFRQALGALKDGGYEFTAFGPTDLTEVQDMMPGKGSFVRAWATAGFFFGAGGYWIMAVLTSWIFGLRVGGKPPTSNVPCVTLAFEGAMLFGVLGALVGLLISARLGARKPPRHHQLEVTRNSYGIEIECGFWEQNAVSRRLEDAGAAEVEGLEKPLP